jgi:hypothetical protein
MMNARSTAVTFKQRQQAVGWAQRNWLAGLMLLVAVGFPARGVTLVSDNRSVSVVVSAPAVHAQTPNCSATDRPSAHFADSHLGASATIGWEDINGWTPASTYGSVRQDALLTPDQIGMNNLLFVSVGGDPYGVHCPTGASGTAWARSVFDIQFSIATRTEYTYLFNFDPTSTLLTANLLLISDSTGPEQLARTFGSPGYGVLDPGLYTLHYDFSSRAIGAQSGYNSSSVLFNFSPGPVPEPSAFALLVVGAVAMAAMNRSWKRQ